MDAHYGFLSLITPLVAIVLAIRTKQVYVSLLLGIFLACLVIESWNPWTAFTKFIESLVTVFADGGNTRTILFSALIGAVILYIQRSGGVEGFTQFLQSKLQHFTPEDKGNRFKVQGLAFLTGVLIFVESSISVLTTGTLFRPVFDKLKISREKLAYIADSSSAPICILLPFNGWGALVMSLLAAQAIEHPFQTMIESILFNFYPILALLLLFFVIRSGKDFHLMSNAENRTKKGKILWENSTPMVSEEITNVARKSGIPAKAMNMAIPLIFLVALMPVFLIVTGWENVADSSSFIFSKLLFALGEGSGSSSVLYSVICCLLICIILYSYQGFFNLKEHTDIIVRGVSGLMPIALLLLFAFAIGNLCKELGTGVYVASITKEWLSPGLVPALIFVVSAFVAFSTGTSWGTFSIMIPIAIPMAENLGVDHLMAIGAALGGGIFGDHCSPISDTTILSSMAAATDHIDHVKTQLPYAILAGVVSLVLYLLVGFI